MLFLARAAFWLLLVGWLMSRWSAADLQAGVNAAPEALAGGAVPRACIDAPGACIETAWSAAQLLQRFESKAAPAITAVPSEPFAAMPLPRPADLR